MPAGYVIYADNTTRYFNPSHPVLFWKLYWNKNQVKFFSSSGIGTGRVKFD